MHPDLPKRARRLTLTGGEDYELLFTVEEEDADQLLTLARGHGVQVTQIGQLTEGETPMLLDGSWPNPDFAHFERLETEDKAAV
jgi:thiamine monophosphate kinase